MPPAAGPSPVPPGTPAKGDGEMDQDLPWHDRPARMGTVRKDDGAATTSAELRTHNLARLLRAIHDGGGQLTRAELTRQLSLARGTATVLVRDLAGRHLIEELTSPVDASAQRARGRPTGVPSAHAHGPVALAVDLRDDSFTLAAFELTGRSTVLDRQEREAGSGTGMLNDVAERLKVRRRQFGGRVVGVGIAVPSPVSGSTMVQPTLPEWQDVDVAQALHRRLAAACPVLIGNDATLAGLAEARRGVLRGVSVALHLHVATGIGGVLLAGGQPATGAHGSAGEFGHMPLTGGDEPCRCGAIGCWELDAGARGLLRAAGRLEQLEQGDRVLEAEEVIAAAGTDPRCGRALTHVAEALGRGIGALVNAQDPAAVGLSGLAARVYDADPAAVRFGYLCTLMRYRRADPPALLPSTLGDLGALTGASELVFDAFLTPRGLGAWPSPEQKTA
jgi:predicted NBD/HSP70 family sugar kinase